MPKKRKTFADELRRLIDQSEKTRYQISQETGIAQSVLSRFMHGKSGLSIESIDLLCQSLGLRLVEDNPAPKRKGR